MSIRRLINTAAKPTLPDETEVMDPEIDSAGDVIDALGSETAHNTLALPCEEALLVSTIAKRLGTSIQNVRYHRENFREVELTTVQTPGTAMPDAR